MGNLNSKGVRFVPGSIHSQYTLRKRGCKGEVAPKRRTGSQILAAGAVWR
jgi:hypothetical protein